MAQTIVITQSNYIPWKGYFDVIRQADAFILYDTAQYTRRDWRNRNKIKTANGLTWLSIPVNAKGNYTLPINEMEISEPDWAEKHWKTIKHAYNKAPFFDWTAEWLEPLYLKNEETHLSKINYLFLRAFCEKLGIDTPFYWSHDYELTGDRTGKLVNLCKQFDGTHYITGPTAQGYMDEEQFNDAGITFEYFKFKGYPEYPQLYDTFEHAVSVIDLFMMLGAEASKYITRQEKIAL